ncbi:hypothetical protein D3C71_1295620 [compost metagenome]
MLGAVEHQHLLPVTFTDHLGQQFPLTLLVYEVHALFDLLRRGIAARHFNRCRVVQQLVGQPFDIVGEGRREQQVLTLGRQLGQHAADIMDKAHIQHAVGFVQHQNFNFGQVNGALVFQIQQATRCCHQNVDAAAQFHHLRVDAHTTKYHQRTQAQIFAVGFDVFADLRCQLTGWRQDQRAYRTAAFDRMVMLTQQLQQRQGKASGFTGTGLGAGHQVTTFQYDRNRLALNWRRFAIALFFNSAQNFST